jgi:hypothetical protein
MGHLFTSTPLKSPVFSPGVSIKRPTLSLGCPSLLRNFVPLWITNSQLSTQQTAGLRGTAREGLN